MQEPARNDTPEILGDAVTDQPETGNLTADKKKVNVVDILRDLFGPHKRKKTITILVAAVLFITVAVTALCQLSPSSIAKRYMDALYWGNYPKQQRVMAYDYYAYLLDGDSEEEFFEDRSDHYEEDITSWNDYAKYNKQATIEDYEDWIGDFNISMEVTRVKEMSLHRLESEYDWELENLEEAQLLYLDDITDAKEVFIKVKVEGEDDTIRETYSVCVVKINGMWKVLGCNSVDD